MPQEIYLPEGQSGSIFQINISNGGVPKRAIQNAEISAFGLAGDRQRNLDVHGGTDRAVCLYSLERILALQAEGHPIFPGAAGENLTVTGLSWEAVTPGVRLLLGQDVLVEVTRYTSPCSNIAYAFHEDEFIRISQKVHPGWSRVYARVLQPGLVRVGDPVAME
jgi:MOSC domain-containing protein YiiM